MSTRLRTRVSTRAELIDRLRAQSTPFVRVTRFTLVRRLPPHCNLEERDPAGVYRGVDRGWRPGIYGGMIGVGFGIVAVFMGYNCLLAFSWMNSFGLGEAILAAITVACTAVAVYGLASCAIGFERVYFELSAGVVRVRSTIVGVPVFGITHPSSACEIFVLPGVIPDPRGGGVEIVLTLLVADRRLVVLAVDLKGTTERARERAATLSRSTGVPSRDIGVMVDMPLMPLTKAAGL